MGIEDLIPKDKFDDSHIDELNTIDKIEVIPILGTLLGWLKDPNWPVAQALFPVLPRFQFELIDHILEVFHSSDDIWKNEILLLMANFDKENIVILVPEIKRIMTNPTSGERLEGTVDYAKTLLDKFAL
ncbi:DUF5071 domain-containing protein [Listeria welshimeri]|uniref:DUF5071 domain-containing protein n=1 Tax=Listeria welshimeri TaxID=1643 RepID=UPI001887424B|nr:DUF5071 domain-containing protein [Listeria welshimeri]MBF2451960.1 DUF5071 domain-containing protein [Listeria welshimeri]